jgi:orotate phosphoribosyltransferase
MNYTKSAFIKLALQCQVLQFGNFTLKSGRISPYFFNAGLFYTGNALQQLGAFYASTLIHHHAQFDHLFGPAYKGLPLATATAIALSERGIVSTVTFNRKEIKDHGEGGQLIGAPLTGRTIIIDDVITAGTAFREAQTLIQTNGGKVSGVIIALDRCERGTENKSALGELVNQGIKVYSIINFFDLVEYLETNKQKEELKQMHTYHKHYGIANK